MIFLRYVFIFSLLSGFIFAQDKSKNDVKNTKKEEKKSKTVKSEKLPSWLDSIKEIGVTPSTEVIANFKNEEGPTLMLKLKKGKTLFILDFDPFSNDIFFDIDIRVPKEKKEKKENNKKKSEESPMDKKLKDIMDKIDKLQTSSSKKEDNKKKGMTPEILNHIYDAQKFYYDKNYKAALDEVRRSLEMSETALGKALEGSIHFTMGNRRAAITAWKKALELDPTMSEVEAILKIYGEENQ